MAAGGKDRTIKALLSLRGMGVRAIMAALPTILKDQMDTEAYRVYVSDCLQAIAENTAKYAGGSVIKKRYYDVINPKPVDNRTGEEIAADVIKRAGLKVVKK